MFKLVGKELFTIGKFKCAISVEALGTFAYEYTLEVNGKTYEKFREELNRKLQSWTVALAGEDTRICLGLWQLFLFLDSEANRLVGHKFFIAGQYMFWHWKRIEYLSFR